MTDPPAGALSRLEEVRDLVFKAKVDGKASTLYLVDGNYPTVPSITKVKLTEAACLVGNTLFLNLSAKKENTFSYHDNILLPTFSVGSSGRERNRYMFINYWFAWGYYQRLKKRNDDQQESDKSLLGW